MNPFIEKPRNLNNRKGLTSPSDSKFERDNLVTIVIITFITACVTIVYAVPHHAPPADTHPAPPADTHPACWSGRVYTPLWVPFRHRHTPLSCQDPPLRDVGCNLPSSSDLGSEYNYTLGPISLHLHPGHVANTSSSEETLMS